MREKEGAPTEAEKKLADEVRTLQDAQKSKVMKLEQAQAELRALEKKLQKAEAAAPYAPKEGMPTWVGPLAITVVLMIAVLGVAAFFVFRPKPPSSQTQPAGQTVVAQNEETAPTAAPPAAPVAVVPEPKPQGARMLKFPDARALGALHFRPWDGKEWKQAGAAKGAVNVPANTAVKLVMDQDAKKDLAPLKDLDPNALQSLVVIGNDLTDELFTPVEHLTGLLSLEVMSGSLTAASLERLRPLVMLEELSLDSVRLGDDAMEVLNSFPRLRSLGLHGSTVSNAAAVTIKKLRGLKRLDIRGAEVSKQAVVLFETDMRTCELVK
jgi:hypothetical protein